MKNKNDKINLLLPPQRFRCTEMDPTASTDPAAAPSSRPPRRAPQTHSHTHPPPRLPDSQTDLYDVVVVRVGVGDEAPLGPAIVPGCRGGGRGERGQAAAAHVHLLEI